MITQQATALHISGRCGLGDNIYWRPLVRAAAAKMPVFLETPWPELFRDIANVHFVKPRTNLRTQLKNIGRHHRAKLYVSVPKTAQPAVLRYGWEDLPHSNVFAVMESHLPVPCNPFVFDLPDFGEPPIGTDRPIAVLRPATERREWLNSARNPKARYVTRAARLLRDAGFYTVQVADLDRAREWLVGGERMVTDKAFLNGELGVPKLLALVQHAAVVVGPVGWIVPACLAAKVPLIVVSGGQGAHNHPDRLIDPRMDASRTRFIMPDPYCMCDKMRHGCTKVIPEFDAQFTAALEAVAHAG